MFSRSRTEPALVEVDYSTVERRIGKQPNYEGKPSYGLFIFDPAGEFRVWTVLDANALYFDHEGTGDLTAPDKRIPAKWEEHTLDVGAMLETLKDPRVLAKIPESKRASTLEKLRAQFAAMPEPMKTSRSCTFSVPRLVVPGTSLVHTQLRFSISPVLPGVSFSMLWAGKHRVFAGSHRAGNPKFAASPELAPILRPSVLSPLTIARAGFGFEKSLDAPLVMKIGEENKLYLRFGHQGSGGEETFCSVHDEYLKPGKDRIFAALFAGGSTEAAVRAEIKEHC